ncbi:MAG TPA: hypothetical protein VMT03_10480 [Polyangia bacterium]|nr:hypothetical protein [Polyangia bacterium]
MGRALAWSVLILAMGGCSGGHLASPDGPSGSLVASECHWSSGLSDADGRTACVPARALVQCTSPGGGGIGCTTDGQISCAGVGESACVSSCATNQYVVSCGGVGPGPVPDPPAGCTFESAVPAGIAYYCCPCE